MYQITIGPINSPSRFLHVCLTVLRKKTGKISKKQRERCVQNIGKRGIRFLRVCMRRMIEKLFKINIDELHQIKFNWNTKNVNKNTERKKLNIAIDEVRLKAKLKCDSNQSKSSMKSEGEETKKPLNKNRNAEQRIRHFHWTKDEDEIN